MKVWMLSLVVVVIAAFSVFSKAEAMTAERVVENAIASAERQLEGVKDITIISDKGSVYYKRVIIDGESTFMARVEADVMGMKFTTVYDGIYLWSVNPLTGKLEKEKLDHDPFQWWKNLRILDVKHDGTEVIDGYKTHILKIEDVSRLMGFPVEGVMIGSGRVWIDAENWVLRRIEMEMTVEDEQGKKMTGNIISSMKDYRMVEGILFPFLTETVMPVMLPPGKEQEIRQGLKQMKEELEKMPPAERKMFEAMMGPKIKAMEDMLAGKSIVENVLQVKVNTGLSDELFDGSKLIKR